MSLKQLPRSVILELLDLPGSAELFEPIPSVQICMRITCSGKQILPVSYLLASVKPVTCHYCEVNSWENDFPFYSWSRVLGSLADCCVNWVWGKESFSVESRIEHPWVSSGWGNQKALKGSHTDVCIINCRLLDPLLQELFTGELQCEITFFKKTHMWSSYVKEKNHCSYGTPNRK